MTRNKRRLAVCGPNRSVRRALALGRPLILDRDLGVLYWRAHDGDKLVKCGITIAALQGHFDLSDGNVLLASLCFKQHRARIEQVAYRKYRDGRVEKDGSVLVEYRDL